MNKVMAQKETLAAKEETIQLLEKDILGLKMELGHPTPTFNSMSNSSLMVS